MTKFAELSIGATFDFVDEKRIGYNSFFDRCVKIGPRTYRSLESGFKMRVGTIKAEVHHVDFQKPTV